MNTAARQRPEKQLKRPMRQRTRHHPMRKIVLLDGIEYEVEAGTLRCDDLKAPAIKTWTIQRHPWMFSFNTWQFFLLSNSFMSNVSYVSEPVHSIFPDPLARVSSRTKLPPLSSRVRPTNTRHPEKCSSKRVPESAQISSALSSRLNLGRAKT